MEVKTIKSKISKLVQFVLGLLSLIAFPIITYSFWPTEMHANNPDLELIVGIQYALKCIGACFIGYLPLHIVSYVIYDKNSW
jgi:hypothetical protein